MQRAEPKRADSEFEECVGQVEGRPPAGVKVIGDHPIGGTVDHVCDAASEVRAIGKQPYSPGGWSVAPSVEPSVVNQSELQHSQIDGPATTGASTSTKCLPASPPRQCRIRSAAYRVPVGCVVGDPAIR